MKRASGVLLHVSSLPGPFGIGTLGEEAYRFVNQLAEAGVRYWQVLPLTPPGSSNSPYASVSCFANNELFIDPRRLAEEGFFSQEELQSFYHKGMKNLADFGFATANVANYLHLAFSRVSEEQHREMLAFVNAESYWLNDYALFEVIHRENNYASWLDWTDELRLHNEKALVQYSMQPEHISELEYIYFAQWQFRRQWDALKAYANAKGVLLIGDMPIFPALDSADVWASPEQFQLDEDGNPTAKAGVPPDYFSEDGQLWGNPLYDWDFIEEDEYKWWVQRVGYSMKLFDVIRIDHFRGFDSYWAVPAESTTAKHGVWRRGPGMKLFEKLTEELDHVNIIAEDLGDINEDVAALVEESGYPGMKVLQFAFDDKERGTELPYTYPVNKVIYTGTHDNNTVYGWLEQADEETREFALDYVRMPDMTDWRIGGPYSPSVRAFIETAWSTPCVLAVAPVQDLLGYGDNTRMNTPGTNTSRNWVFRIDEAELARLDTAWLYRMNQVFQRLDNDNSQMKRSQE